MTKNSMTADRAQPGRREAKKTETRRRIRQAALDIALDHGVEALTIDMVAEQAGCSRRTIFNYFDCSEDLLVSNFSGMLPHLCAALEKQPVSLPIYTGVLNAMLSTDPFEVLGSNREQARARQKLVWNYPHLAARQLRHEQQGIRQLARAIAEWKDLDVFEDMRPMIAATTATATFRVAVRRWAKSNQDESLENYVRQAFAQLTELITASTETTNNQ